MVDFYERGAPLPHGRLGHHWEMRCLLAGLAVAVGLLSGCNTGPAPRGYDASGLPLGDIPQSFVEARAEGHLNYPGSFVEGRYGSSYQFSALKPAPAYAGLRMRSTDTSPQIYDWYHSWLLAHGWSGPYQEGARPAGSISSESYHRGAREVVRIIVGLELPTLTKFEVAYSIIPVSR